MLLSLEINPIESSKEVTTLSGLFIRFRMPVLIGIWNHKMKTKLWNVRYTKLWNVEYTYSDGISHEEVQGISLCIQLVPVFYQVDINVG